MPPVTSNSDVFVDATGKIVAGDSPEAALKIASKGVVIPRKIAARYGIESDGTPIEKPTLVEEPAAKTKK